MMPVSINNDLWFNVPGTQDLIESSGTVPCPHPSPKRANKTQSLLLPNTVNNHAKPFLFSSPPTFYRILDNCALSAIPYLEALKEEQVNMAVRLQKRGIIKENVSRIRNTSMFVGQSLLSLHESATQKLLVGVEDGGMVKWSILYTILWIAIPVTIIFFCVVACVIYAKLFFFRRATSTAASAMFSKEFYS
ncbi:unnamed protein product [Cylicostephanus goldi]|uniref:Uncharacterized protein n=1 Tax=Cylicostephanus goldi TaxID=71465 RepID=A0A3P6SRK4_CYLGO|nr:unnamed protein product [Cylicostephanus goldi]